MQQPTWTSPVTNRVLLEAGFGTYLTRWGATRCRATRRATSCASSSSARRGVRPTAASRTSPIARRTGRRTGWAAHLERVGLLCHRRAQHEVRLPGHVLRRRREDFTNDQKLPYRVNNGVPEPDHADADHSTAKPRPLHAALRAGAVDPRPHDAAGRAALRPRVELLPRTMSVRRASCRRRSSSRRPTAWPG